MTKLITFLIAIQLILSVNEIFAKDNSTNYFYLDREIQISYELIEGDLVLRLKNIGSKPRNISDLILNANSFIDNNLSIEILDYSKPRQIREEFRMSGDGSMGANSNFNVVTYIDLKQNETNMISINILDSIRKIRNEKVEEYMKNEEVHFRIVLKYPLKCIDINTESEVQFLLPLMIIQNNDIKFFGS